MKSNPERKCSTLVLGFACEASGGSEWRMKSEPDRIEAFHAISRLGPRVLNKQHQKDPHYSDYNTKFANSWYFHSNSCRITLDEPSLHLEMTILFMEIHCALSPPCFNNCNRMDGIKCGTSTDLLIFMSVSSIHVCDMASLFFIPTRCCEWRLVWRVNFAVHAEPHYDVTMI